MQRRRQSVRRIIMPIFEYLCLNCGLLSKILVVAYGDNLDVRHAAAAKAIKLQDAYGEKSCDRQWNEAKK